MQFGRISLQEAGIRVENEKRQLAEEIRLKRRLLALAVQMAGDFQSEIVQKLSREIDVLIVKYTHLEILRDNSLGLLEQQSSG